jgi:uncharacterized membrane protein
VPSDINNRDRWLAAVGYLSILVVIPLLAKSKSSFLARHTRQAFALFFVEIAGLVFLLIIDSTLGRVPFLGILVLIILKLVLFLLFFSVSVLGFMKAIFGQQWRIPYLDDLAERIPVE